jgi:hypothetical protein
LRLGVELAIGAEGDAEGDAEMARRMTASMKTMSRFSFASKLVACIGFAAMSTAAGTAIAEQAPPVDVTIKEAEPPQRVLTVQYNPLALFIWKLSADVVVTPTDHHALVLSPFYAWPSTVHISTQRLDDNGTAYTYDIPSQSFTGFGGEIGYRYYGGLAGPRGFFLGPSLLLASMTATAANNKTTSFFDYGFAIDAGYGALLAERFALTLGAGAQYVLINKTIPDQQYPASIFANSGLRPRFLASLGYAF